MFKKKKDTKAKTTNKHEELEIKVIVGRAGSSTKEVFLNGDRTVMDALNAAGLSKKDSEIVSVNKKEVDEDELDSMELKEGDRVVLVKHVEGGLI